MTKRFRSKDSYLGVKFDPAVLVPDGVIRAAEGRDLWLWRDSHTGTFSEIKPGQWILVCEKYGTRHVYDERTLLALHEEIPDAGEGGGADRPH
jgi:hypothetical protein